MQIVRFTSDHLAHIDLQDAQIDMRTQFGDPAYGHALEQTKYAFTAIADGGIVLACAGVHEVWAGRGIAWALISRHAGGQFRPIHRAVAGFLKQCPVRRIEMMVDNAFDEGHRWARMLGMQHEGVMRAYSPTGDDYAIYARVKNG